MAEPVGRARFVVRGTVQGVGFRYAAQRTAQRLGLSGWVRNRPDGSVEVLAYGPEPALGQLERWLGQGPRVARVTAVTRTDDPPDEPAAQGFTIR